MIISRKSIRFSIVACMLAFLLPQISNSQIEEGQTVDKIVAVVGAEIITLSDVNVSIMRLQQLDNTINPYDEAVRKRVLNNLIDEKLMITKAIEDSIVVSDEEIDQRLDHLIMQYEQMYGSKKRIENVFGMSITEIRYQSRDIIMKQMLAERLKNRVFAEMSVTPKEVSEFYERMKDSIPRIPAQMEVAHIVKFIDASEDQKKDVIELAKRVRDSIASGGDFAEFAKRHSDDTYSAVKGGELGWFSRGQLMPEFEKEAFSLSEGQISLPVETPFGFHIIETLEKTHDKVRSRHILFRTGKGTEDIDRAKQYLLDVKKKYEDGEDFAKLALEYSEEDETKGFGGHFGMWDVHRTPQELKAVLDKLEVGELSEPMEYISPKDGKKAQHILLKKAYIEAHDASLETDGDYIEELALVDKKNKALLKLIAKLRKDLYWEIKE
jgi:peptidyl-prolyl cis-trans isomerase SurA